MPFDTRAAFKFTLAIAAAISAQTLQAEESTERLWSCNLTPSGEWDCEVDETLMQQQAKRPDETLGSSEAERTKSSLEETSASPSAETDEPKGSQHETVMATPAQATARDTVTPATLAAPVVTNGAPAPIAWPAPASPVTPTQAAPVITTSTITEGWDCVASGDSWDCNEAAATSTQRLVADVPPAGQYQTLSAASKPEWNCTAGNDDWECKEVPGSAPAVASRTANPEPMPASASALDWYAYAPGQAPGACHGRYIEPEFDFLEDDRPFEQQPIYVNALSSSSQTGGLTQLEGGIQIQRGGRLITSARGEYDQGSNSARLFGQVNYREQGLLLRGDQADADMLSGNTRFYNAQYVLHQEHMRGQAKQITRFGDRRIQLDEGAITYCEPGSNAWQIAAGKIELDPETGRGVARHATLDIAGVPVLYTPYLSFPIDDRRQSGFLYPSVSYSESDGIDIALPYYFNLAANIDDTLTPRYIGERGLLLENELRYMSRRSHNKLSTAWLGNDSQYEGDRWLLGFQHTGTPMANLHSRIDFTRVSDDNYFEDLGSSLEVQRDDHLDQLFELRYLQPGLNLSLRTLSYQTIDGTAPYEKLPQMLLSGYKTGLAGLVDLDYSAEFVQFKRDLEGKYGQNLTGLNRTEGSRLHVRPRLSLSLERPWGYLRPAVTFWHSEYDLENDKNASLDGSHSISAGILSLDTGMTFERSFELADGNYTQTLEPRLFLLHADVDSDEQNEIPTFDSSQLDFTYYNLFHETGWSGKDRVADTQQATLGLSSAVYSGQGIEKLRLGVAQAHYFADREYAGRPGDTRGGSTESASNLATLANWNFTRNLRLTHNGEVDRDSYQFLEHNYKLSYLPDDKRLLYISYRDNIEKKPDDGNQQLDMAFRWPLNSNWTGYGRWQQDLEENENLETLLGVEYASCCWKVRLTGRTWVVDPNTVGTAEEFETDNGIFLQFVLRGLGAFGQGEGREFLEEITGYDEDDNGAF